MKRIKQLLFQHHIDRAFLTPHPAVLWWCEVAVTLVIALWLGGWLLPTLTSTREMASYRATVREVSDALRILRPRALAQQRIMRLRVDSQRRGFQVVTALDATGAYERVDQTIWLPQGLQITEAPSVVTISPRGELAEASITIVAPDYNRVFRVMVDAGGRVRLAEESML